MTGLRRDLSRWELTYLSLGGIIGSGWLFAPLAAAAYAGPSSIFAWILGGLMMLIIAFSYAEVSSSIPASGGIVRYPHMTHGRLVGFTMSWIYLISAVSTVAIEAVAATTYLSHFFPSLYDNGLSTSGIVLTYVLLVVFFLANYFGVKLLGRVSHGLGWWKLLIPTITSILLFLDFNQSNFAYILPNNLAGPGGIDGILFAIPSSGIIFSYLGFRQAIEYGGEGRNPQRDIPFALVSSIAIAMLIFTMLQLGFIGALNWNVAGLPYGDWSGLLTSSISDSPIISLFQEASILSYVWVSILAFDAVFSPSGTGIIYTGTTARTFYASAVNGYLPSVFSRVNFRGIPSISLIVSVIAAALFLLPIPSWYSIVSISTLATVLTYVTGGIVLHVFRNKLPQMSRPYSLRGWKIIAPLSTIVAGLLIYWSGFTTLFYITVASILGLSIFAMYPRIITVASIVVELLGAYFTVQSGFNIVFTSIYLTLITFIAILSVKISKLPTDEKRAGYWIIFLIMLLTGLSYVGPFGIIDVITFPYDIPLVIFAMLGLHFMGVRLSKYRLEIPNYTSITNSSEARNYEDN